MSFKRLSIGKSGEEIASRFLEKNGYTIIVNNYRHKCGEIDIIAKNNEYLVFIEVKTRTGKAYGHPLEAITRRKQNQISRVAQCYLAENSLIDTAARFDVVSVIMSPGVAPQVELIANAFDLC